MNESTRKIYEEFLKQRFAGDVDDVSRKRWGERFERRIEWQNASFHSRGMLQQIAPSIYPLSVCTAYMRKLPPTEVSASLCMAQQIRLNVNGRWFEFFSDGIVLQMFCLKSSGAEDETLKEAFKYILASHTLDLADIMDAIVAEIGAVSSDNMAALRDAVADAVDYAQCNYERPCS